MLPSGRLLYQAHDESDLVVASASCAETNISTNSGPENSSRTTPSTAIADLFPNCDPSHIHWYAYVQRALCVTKLKLI